MVCLQCKNCAPYLSASEVSLSSFLPFPWCWMSSVFGEWNVCSLLKYFKLYQPVWNIIIIIISDLHHPEYSKFQLFMTSCDAELKSSIVAVLCCRGCCWCCNWAQFGVMLLLVFCRSTSVFVLLYAGFYYVKRSNMSGALQTAEFFGYMILACYAFSMMLGAVSFFSSLWFVRYIYVNIKVDWWTSSNSTAIEDLWDSNVVFACTTILSVLIVCGNLWFNCSLLELYLLLLLTYLYGYVRVVVYL